MGTAGALSSTWFDGRSPRARAVQLLIDSDHLLLNDGTEVHRYPVADVRWPERRTHGQRQCELPDGGLLQHADGAEWDDWCQRSGLSERAVVRWQQSWRGTLGAAAGTVLLLWAFWIWGIPALSHVVVSWLPPSVDATVGERSLRELDRLFLKPSTLPEAQQAHLRKRFEALLERTYPHGDVPAWQLRFHQSPALKANAFALPGGYIVVTDDLVQLLADQPDTILGVMAHEWGHVRQRHGLKMVVQASLVSAVVGVVMGDASGFLVTVPAAMATQSYSRDAERQADAEAATMLHQSGISPAVMVVFFERMRASSSDRTPQRGDRADGPLPISISSHPDDDERIRFFREWR
ncbi:M48 family metallopeptidase [Hydrogenophaga sp.]|uniref:M48 family metallopeptidase n=1 Tax=Hydrogenophaga sp. TaxID=1904254 RepID=UPI003561EBDB